MRTIDRHVRLALSGQIGRSRRLLRLIILSVQVLAGVMLPSAIIFLQLLLNDRELLGDEFSNKLGTTGSTGRLSLRFTMVDIPVT